MIQLCCKKSDENVLTIYIQIIQNKTLMITELFAYLEESVFLYFMGPFCP